MECNVEQQFRVCRSPAPPWLGKTETGSNAKRNKSDQGQCLACAYLSRRSRPARCLGLQAWDDNKKCALLKSIDCGRTCFASLNCGGKTQMGWEGGREKKGKVRSRSKSKQVRGEGLRGGFVHHCGSAVLPCTSACRKRPRRRRLHSKKRSSRLSNTHKTIRTAPAKWRSSHYNALARLVHGLHVPSKACQSLPTDVTDSRPQRAKRAYRSTDHLLVRGRKIWGSFKSAPAPHMASNGTLVPNPSSSLRHAHFPVFSFLQRGQGCRSQQSAGVCLRPSAEKNTGPFPVLFTNICTGQAKRERGRGSPSPL